MLSPNPSRAPCYGSSTWKTERSSSDASATARTSAKWSECFILRHGISRPKKAMFHGAVFNASLATFPRRRWFLCGRDLRLVGAGHAELFAGELGTQRNALWIA